MVEDDAVSSFIPIRPIGSPQGPKRFYRPLWAPYGPNRDKNQNSTVFRQGASNSEDRKSLRPLVAEFQRGPRGTKRALSPRGPPMGLIRIKLKTAPFSTLARRMLKTASRYHLWLLSFSVAHEGLV